MYHLASCVKGTSDSETKSLFWSRLIFIVSISPPHLPKHSKNIFFRSRPIKNRILTPKIGHLRLGLCEYKTLYKKSPFPPPFYTGQWPPKDNPPIHFTLMVPWPGALSSRRVLLTSTLTNYPSSFFWSPLSLFVSLSSPEAASSFSLFIMTSK